MPFVEDSQGGLIAVVEDHRADAIIRAINCHDELVAMVDSLTSELNLVIDELNTMRDIHHRDPLTPADHWDKELLHDVQLSLAKIRD